MDEEIKALLAHLKSQISIHTVEVNRCNNRISSHQETIRKYKDKKKYSASILNYLKKQQADDDLTVYQITTEIKAWTSSVGDCSHEQIGKMTYADIEAAVIELMGV